MKDGVYEAGESVVARGVDDASGEVFVGNIIVPSTGGAFSYYRSARENNVRV